MELITEIRENGLRAEVLSAPSATGKMLYGSFIFYQKTLVKFVSFGIYEKEELIAHVTRKMRKTTHSLIDQNELDLNGDIYKLKK
jgi:hypothetical protein